MNSDFKDLLRIFAEEEVEYLIVGAYAVIHYTQPRYTKNNDLWIRPSVDNAAKVARAFHRFGLPLIEVTQEDFEDYYQEVCLQIWKSSANFREQSEWSTWIYRLTLNGCLTLLKKKV